jgi:UBX domain-containing protein 1
LSDNRWVTRGGTYTLELFSTHVTSLTASQAHQYLVEHGWDLSSAASAYYTAKEEGMAPEGAGEAEPEPYSGPRTLDGRPAPISAIPTVASSSRAAARPPRRGGIATLGSLNQAPEGGHTGHNHDDDDSDDEDYQDDEQPRDLFAGGEKSGLAVQDPARRNDPRSVVNDIIKKAQA